MAIDVAVRRRSRDHPPVAAREAQRADAGHVRRSGPRLRRGGARRSGSRQSCSPAPAIEPSASARISTNRFPRCPQAIRHQRLGSGAPQDGCALQTCHLRQSGACASAGASSSCWRAICGSLPRMRCFSSRRSIMASCRPAVRWFASYARSPMRMPWRCMLTGRRFSAAELLERGVLNQVVASDKVEPVAMDSGDADRREESACRSDDQGGRAHPLRSAHRGGVCARSGAGPAHLHQRSREGDLGRLCASRLPPP